MDKAYLVIKIIGLVLALGGPAAATVGLIPADLGNKLGNLGSILFGSSAAGNLFLPSAETKAKRLAAK